MNEDAVNTAAQQGGSMIGGLVGLAILVFLIAAMWKVFTKAGKAGWLILIPIVNVYQLLKIAGRPGWWLILFIIPLVNLIISIWCRWTLPSRSGRARDLDWGWRFWVRSFIRSWDLAVRLIWGLRRRERGGDFLTGGLGGMPGSPVFYFLRVAMMKSAMVGWVTLGALG